MLRQKLRRLIGDETELANRVTVDAIDEIGINLYERSFGTPKVAQTGMIRSLISSVSQELGGHTFSDRFLEQEWTDVVDAWQLRTWESYGDVARLGRRSRLTEKQRASIWPIFERAQQRLHDGALVTLPVVYREIGAEVTRSKEQPWRPRTANLPDAFLLEVARG